MDQDFILLQLILKKSGFCDNYDSAAGVMSRYNYVLRANDYRVAKMLISDASVVNIFPLLEEEARSRFDIQELAARRYRWNDGFCVPQRALPQIEGFQIVTVPALLKRSAQYIAYKIIFPSICIPAYKKECRYFTILPFFLLTCESVCAMSPLLQLSEKKNGRDINTSVWSVKARNQKLEISNEGKLLIVENEVERELPYIEESGQRLYEII